MQIKRSDIALATSIGISIAGLMFAKKVRDKRPVKFRARIIGYHVGELHTEFEDVSGRVLNHTELFILSPNGYKRRILFIYHPSNAGVEGIWKNIGDEIEFTMSREMLNKALQGNIKLMSADMNLSK